ncbi:recombinase family protein [Paenibacillus sp. MWE-103]|uniref:Recombinase family protein n=1 Tax=Paenibacillus artemisiicola TaxID=1172618 RepID=A0ABS3WHZ4_9BACL|nr:recombinase family protein [Paenibacillus artemisiicola]MBO7747912.1 recombinase family protein [Paenibacillus artemisiicola]
MKVNVNSIDEQDEVVNSNNQISVAAYCRVSTDSEEQATSFKNQQSYFRREISKDKKLKLFRIYADQGISGTSLNRREEFSRLLYDAGLDEIKVSDNKSVFTVSHREPLFKYIYVKNTSRFARNVLVIEILRELLKKGVYVYFLDINHVFDSIEKEFMLNMFLNFSQQESIDKSAKVRFGLVESARKGTIFTNNNIYGYKYSKDTKELTVIEEEAEVIRTIFFLYSKGFGIRRILNYFEGETLETLDGVKYVPSGVVRTRAGKPFVPTFIKRVLSNEKYYGTLVRNKYDTGSIFSKKTATVKNTSEWILFEGRIPAIISKELFETCNSLRKAKLHHKNQTGVFRGYSEFASKIYCGKCGSSYTRNIDAGRVFFNCSLKKTKGTNACDNINVQETDINAQIDDIRNYGLISVFALHKEKQIEIIRNHIEKLRERINVPAVEDINSKTLELMKLDDQESRVMNLYVIGNFPEAKLHEMKIVIDTQREALRKEINELSKTNEDILIQINDYESRISKINALTVKDEYSREEILGLISKFVVTSEVVPYIKKKDNRESSKIKPIITYELSILEKLEEA